jgi:hypothetical protein
MILKLSRGVWLISVLGLLAALLYVYAGLPEQMILMAQGSDFVYGSRETFFYLFLVAITVINALAFVVGSLYSKDRALRIWFNMLLVILNIFFVISLLFLGALNSSERVNFEKIGITVYVSVGLIAVWAVAWPIFAMFRKFSGKQTV